MVEPTTRCMTRQGPHAVSLLGPNSATTGVCIAAAMCIGAESTPISMRAAPISAPSSGSVSSPDKSITGARAAARIRRGARNQHECLVQFFGPYSDTAQRIEILFDDVALGVAW